MELHEIISKYGTPSSDLISQRDNGKGAMLSYVGHADVTKMLIEIDPLWEWQPAAWIEGRPAIHKHHAKMVFRNGDIKETDIVTMWGFMTVLGKTLPCVGSAPADKEDVEKELIGDLIRNGAMRFGICLNLWAKSDDYAPQPRTERQQGSVTITEPAGLASDKQKGMIRTKCKQQGKTPPANLDTMTKREASAYIDKLLNGGTSDNDGFEPVYLDQQEPF